MSLTDTLQAALDAVSAARGRTAPPRFDNGRASVVIDASGLDPGARTRLEHDVRASLAAVASVTEVRVLLTSERIGRRLIAVASGKGGVGKSTVSANLAIALARSGVPTGIVDADIYGPSQPTLFGAREAKPAASGDRLRAIDTRFGVPMLSIGQMLAPGKALAWRGPMAATALGQLIDADWGDVTTLIADLPPGTGDVQLSMIQKHRPAGAVIVSTPQDLALIDARRAIDLFNTAGVPVIGLVENMAGYACPACGVVSDPFGRGGAEAAAAELGLPFLGRIPLALAIREGSDAGEPPAGGTGPHAQAFEELAARVRHWLEQTDAAHP